MLYTNAVASDRVTIVDLAGSPDTWKSRTVLVKAPVQAVFPAPDGEHAIVFLGQAGGSRYVAGFSVVPLVSDLPPKLVPLEAPPSSIAFEPGPSEHALLTVTDSANINQAYLVHMPSLQTDAISLPSTPLSAGVVPETKRAFVAQKHGEGRITFVELASGEPRTLTGFELSQKVDDGN